MSWINKIYLVLLLLPISAQANEVFVVDDGFYLANIAQHSDLLQDPESRYMLEDVRAPEISMQFAPNTDPEPYFGYGSGAVWLRLKIANRSPRSKICFLRYPYPMIRNIAVYQFGVNSTLESNFAGLEAPQYRQQIQSAKPVFKIHLLPSEIKTIYIRVENRGVEFPLPIELHSEFSLLSSNEYTLLLSGIMYGLTLFIILFNLFLYINLRKQIYIRFILYALCAGFYLSVRDGLAMRYFWGYSLWLSGHAPFIGAILPCIFLLRFTQSALKTEYYMPKLNTAMRVLIYINIVFGCLSLFFEIPPYSACNLMIFTSFVPMFIAGFKAMRLKHLSLPIYFFVATAAVAAGTGLLLLKNFGFANNSLGELGLRIGFILQLIIVSFGLTAMFKNILNEKNKQSILNLRKLNELKDQINIELETQVDERTQELAMKNMELTTAMRELGAERDIYQVQRDVIRKQTEETSGSIRYAQRLQQNLSDNCIHHLEPFEGFFILNRPKAIVSGDFYWVRQVERKVLVAVADCTGHGVPGAFMSVLGITFLNDIVRYDHLTSPECILDSLRAKVIESFSGDKQNAHSAKDGMDIALVSIDIDTLQMQFAGAYNPLYIVRGTDLICINGDKMPISIHEKQNLPFASHSLQLHREDKLYLFSDGYVDQFGWRTGKKFKHAQFKQILLELSDVPIEAQKSVLEKTLNGWIGDLEQVDDIMILGLKI